MHADPNNSLKGGSKSGSTKPLIVTRGLQAILDKDLRKRDADAATTTKTTKKKKLVGPPGTAPKFVLCYLCGRQFGSASIDIHRPQCYLKKMIEWERTGTGIRGPRPVDPETHERQMKERLQAQAAAGDGRSAVAGSKMSDSDAYNAMQMDAFNTNGLMPCPNCGRTFLPDRLQVHLRSCRPGTTSKPVRKAAAKTTTTTTSSSSPTSSSPAPAAAAVADATAPPPPAPNTAAAERPIASSGKYVVPEGADADATPTTTTTTTTTKNVAAAANTSAREESSTQDPRSPSPSSAKANTSVERSSEAPTSPPQETPEKKIKFNNVSHFKNVQSKLQLNKKASSPPCGGGDEVVEMPGAPSSSAAGLIPCKHCGRTFNPDRVVKHESVCADRNKPTTTTTTTTKKPAEIKSKKAAPAKKATTKAAATTTTTAKAKPTTTTTTEVKAATSAAVSTEATPSPERSADVVAQVSPRTSAVAFCGDCGAKLTASGQKFCNACGERLPAPTE